MVRPEPEPVEVRDPVVPVRGLVLFLLLTLVRLHHLLHSDGPVAPRLMAKVRPALRPPDAQPTKEEAPLLRVEETTQTVAVLPPLPMVLRVARFPLLPPPGRPARVVGVLPLAPLLDRVDRVAAAVDPFVPARHVALGYSVLRVVPLFAAP